MASVMSPAAAAAAAAARSETRAGVSVSGTSTCTSPSEKSSFLWGASSRSLLPDVSGSWAVRDVENLDGLLAAAGAPWLIRKLLRNMFAKATMTIVQNKSVIYVEDRTSPKDADGKHAMLKFVEGVDNTRKDNYGFKLTERCKWTFCTTLETFVWTLETYGYYNNRFGPVVSRFYLHQQEDNVMVSEVSFKGETMMRNWVREPGTGTGTTHSGIMRSAKPPPLHADVKEQERRRSSSGKPTTNGKSGSGLKIEMVPSSKSDSAVVSEEEEVEEGASAFRVLLYGKGGWLGCQIAAALVCQDMYFEFGDGRIENREAIQRDVDRVRPTHIINASGKVVDHDSDSSGIDPSSIDAKMMASNLVGVGNLASVCWERNIHLTHFSELELSKPGKDSFYLWTKEKAEDLLKPFKDTFLILTLGITMNADIKHPGSGFARLRRKAAKGQHLDMNPKALSVLPELLPWSLKMIKRKASGTINLVNPGKVSEARLLSLYKRYVLPELTLYKEEGKSNEGKSTDAVQYLPVIASPAHKDLRQILGAEDSLRKYVFAPNTPVEEEDTTTRHRKGNFCSFGMFCAPMSCFSINSCKSISYIS